MNKPKESQGNTASLSDKGRKKRYLAIFLIATGIVSLVITPQSLRWLIFLEGSIGVIGVILFVYARLQFWRAINKGIK